jgi:glucosamine 6-phosphate synthetase-like amidotransferase/phosphosugar isomerase protein
MNSCSSGRFIGAEQLINLGYVFQNQTDIEVIGRLVDSMYNGDLFDTCSKPSRARTASKRSSRKSTAC